MQLTPLLFMGEIKLAPSEKMNVIASQFISEHDLIHFNGSFYLYNEGIWRMENNENTFSWIATEYTKRWAEVALDRHKKEITKMIQDKTYEKYRKHIKYLNNDGERPNEVNIKGGILNLNTLAIRPYTKEDFVFHKLPYDYIEKPYCPVLNKFLTTSMNFPYPLEDEKDGEDYRKVMYFIQEWMGYAMLPGNPLAKALIMYGDGRNGKGVLQYIWGHILGRHNVSYVDIQSISDKKEIFMTKNKLVNFSYDIEAGQQLDTGVIKSAIAGETISVNEKYKPQYEMDFTAKLVIACNDLPYIRNVGAAVRERFYVLPFSRVFLEHERDPELKDKLIEEAEQIFSWAVNGLKRLLARRGFDPPERCIYGSSRYLADNDTVELWLEEDNIRNDNTEVTRQDAWNAYKVYCDKSGYKAGGRNRFYHRMEKKGFSVSTKMGTRYFRGMKLPNQIG